MAKFELPIYDVKTGEVVKTYQRNFMPVSLYIRFQKLSEKIVKDSEKMKSDEELFMLIKDLFLETFSELTEEEYMNNTDVAGVLKTWHEIMSKSATIESKSSKNA